MFLIDLDDNYSSLIDKIKLNFRSI